ncbi:hypothetical protein RvY_12191 [Ramazzottius varieornatus]|uniref:Uncharacterized protein n=1 Tax=Ramazzottius varieornatus TaxID=947166 RepID=A0A1D1VIM1_RAMVA|nr:hypothetical protein RvY_12191 [Ramazzottius varieornatus]
MVQRHTRCIAGYCLVIDKRAKKQTCRFHYPKNVRDVSALKRDEQGTWQFLSGRNDPLLNGHNRVQLQTWRANCDWSAIVDVKALLRYVTKYASKSEKRSQTFGQMFQNLLLQANDDDLPRQAVQRLLITSVNEQDYSAQEVCHLLHSLPLSSEVECGDTAGSEFSLNELPAVVKDGTEITYLKLSVGTNNSKE